MGYGNIGGWGVQFGQQQQQTTPQTFRREIARVQGVDGIKGLQLNPLESVIAIDENEQNIIWIKVMDAAGFPTLKKARFEFIDDTPAVPSGDYVTKKDFDALASKFERLMEELGNGKSDKRPYQQSSGSADTVITNTNNRHK